MAKLLVGHGAMALEGTAGVTVIGDAGIGGHACAGEDEGGTLAEELGGADEGLSRWRGLGGFRDDPLDGADGRAVSHLHGTGEARISECRHRYLLCTIERFIPLHALSRLPARSGAGHESDTAPALT